MTPPHCFHSSFSHFAKVLLSTSSQLCINHGMFTACFLDGYRQELALPKVLEYHVEHVQSVLLMETEHA